MLPANRGGVADWRRFACAKRPAGLCALERTGHAAASMAVRPSIAGLYMLSLLRVDDELAGDGAAEFSVTEKDVASGLNQLARMRNVTNAGN